MERASAWVRKNSAHGSPTRALVLRGSGLASVCAHGERAGVAADLAGWLGELKELMNGRQLGLRKELLLSSFSVFNKSICLQLGDHFREKRGLQRS